MKGLIEKLNCNSQLAKAQRLEQLFNSFIEASDSEYKFSIILFLSLISTSPLHSELTVSPISKDLANLFRPEFLFDSDEESFPEAEESSSSIEEETLLQEKQKKSLNEDSSDEEKTQQDAPSPVETEEFEEELGRIYDNPCSLASNFYSSLCEKASKNSPSGFVLPWPYIRITERELLEKIFMMLLGINTNIFQCIKNSFVITKQIELSHLTPSALNNFLKFFTDLATKLRRISFASQNLQQDECNTYKYFGEACKELFKEFEKEVLTIQEEFTIQSGNLTREASGKLPSYTISLIYLKARLTTMTENASMILEIISKLSSNSIMKTSEILNYLYFLIQNNYALTDHNAFSIIVRIFVMSLQPFLEDLTVWLSQGTVKGLDPGFLIEKSDSSDS